MDEWAKLTDEMQAYIGVLQWRIDELTRLSTVENEMPKKQSSDRTSKLAAKWLQKLKRSKGWIFAVDEKDLAELRALCASVLAQDETKGPRKVKRKAR